MSLPPLVCSTPPPPDQVEEEAYNEEISFNYDISPTHQFEAREFSSYDPPSPRHSVDDTLYVTPSGINVTYQENTGIQSEKETQRSDNVRASPSGGEGCTFSEDSNIEDLDLKLDSMNLDFDSERVVSVEESLNSTFDDFGTFLSNTDFASKLENTFSESDKEFKSQGTCSEESTSLHNEDWDNISQNSLNTNITTGVDKEDSGGGGVLKKDNNDNIPKEVLEVLSPPDDLVSSFNKEESVDSGFKSSVNNSNDQINNIKLDQLDSKSESDSDANTLSFSELNELDKSRIETDKAEDLAVDPSQGHQNDLPDFEIESPLQERMDVCVSDDSVLPLDYRNDFEAFIDTPKEHNEEPASISNSHNDYCEFTTFESENEINDSIKKSDNLDDDANDDFADFEGFQNESDVKEAVSDDKHEDSFESQPVKSDDDFGDFDTYDPAAVKDDSCDAKQGDALKSFTVNDLVFSSDTDVIDILKSAISTIYDEDVSSEGSENEQQYESLSSLGGSWKHLGEYESKQSYLFPWNDSSSQKTLLKSLGIDSRNILYGPKWNSNMPRFAANLGASPLQPIKQNLAPLASEQGEERASQHSNAATDTTGSYAESKMGDWQGIDNFSMEDNQPSSYAESLLLDLEHLMATLDQMTSGQSPHFKISDLFTNACNEREDEHDLNNKTNSQTGETSGKYEKHQPPSILNIGRKINLPDTHIFTPTDSETPWSHTIHYEDTANNFVTDIPEILPHPPNDDFDDFQSHNFGQIANKDSSKISQSKENSPQPFPLESIEQSKAVPCENLPNEFDDFGDFHSATAVEAVVHHSEILPPTGVLQPVKITPSHTSSLPVVNWPDPGDIDTSVFEQLSDLPAPSMQPPLPSRKEIQEQSAKVVEEHKIKPMRLESKDLHIPPYVPPPAPTSFILKETKIDTVMSDDNVPHSNQDLDDFSDFQSSNVSSTDYTPQFCNIQNSFSRGSKHFDYNSPSNAFSQYNNDFQAVHYSQPGPNQINTTSFISTPHHVNYTLPTTLGGSFLKPFNSHDCGPASFSRTEDMHSKNVLQPQQQQQILQPLSLENFSQINWPNPGMDLQDLSRFNPVNSIHSYSESKETKITNNHLANDDDGWSDFVSIKPTNQPVKSQMYNSQNTSGYTNEEDDWSDFVSGTAPVSRSINEVKTISQNIHTQSSNSAGAFARNATQNLNSPYPNIQTSLTSLPPLSYASSRVNHSKNHFQNL